MQANITKMVNLREPCRPCEEGDHSYLQCFEALASLTHDMDLLSKECQHLAAEQAALRGEGEQANKEPSDDIQLFGGLCQLEVTCDFGAAVFGSLTICEDKWLATLTVKGWG